MAVQSGNPDKRSPQIDEAAAAFDEDWRQRQKSLTANPVIEFLRAHRTAHTPLEQTVTGVANVRVKLGDLEQLAELAGWKWDAA